MCCFCYTFKSCIFSCFAHDSIIILSVSFLFHIFFSRSTHNNHIHTNNNKTTKNCESSQENSEFLQLNQNQLHQSSVNVGYSNIAYNPNSGSSSRSAGAGTTGGDLFFLKTKLLFLFRTVFIFYQ